MTEFEYVSTFVSILYAIMLGRAVSTLAGLSFENVNWRHVAWIAILLVNILQTWWKRWGGHDEVYHYGWFVLSVAHTIPMMFAVATLSPLKPPEKWSTYFEINRVRFFSSYGAFWTTLGFSNFLGSGNWQGVIAPILLCAAGAALKNRFVQIAVPILFALMFVAIGIDMVRDAV